MVLFACHAEDRLCVTDDRDEILEHAAALPSTRSGSATLKSSTGLFGSNPGVWASAQRTRRMASTRSGLASE